MTTSPEVANERWMTKSSTRVLEFKQKHLKTIIVYRNTWLGNIIKVFAIKQYVEHKFT